MPTKRQTSWFLRACDYKLQAFHFCLYTILYLQLIQDKIRLGHFQNQTSFQQSTFPNNDISYKMPIKCTAGEIIIYECEIWLEEQ